ncbi:nucleotide sugar dehydrogenase, partial [bacterium]|nr:nucleotide sugar dehydrogenase [bacterium]
MLRPAGGVLLCLLASASNCCDQSSAESSEASTASPAAAQSGSREHSSASILAELPAWKFESAFELLEVPEPSGLCYHPGRNTLFIVDDGCFGRRSAIFEIDLQANVLAKAELCAGVEGIAYCDLEGVCYCEADGMLYVCDENGERVFIVNPEGLELVGWFQVSRFFEGKEVLRARGNGFEGIEYIPVDAARSGLREPYKPGGGYFLLLNQDDPHCVVRIDLEDIDLSPDAAPVPLSGFWEIASINAGETRLDEPGLPELLSSTVKSGALHATGAPTAADVFVVSVPTPMGDGNRPIMDYVRSASEAVGKVLRHSDLVILESTVPPGTTDGLVRETLEAASGLRAGDGFGLAHCPERVLPGQIMREIVENDRIVGASDKRARERASDLYRSFVTGEIYETDALTAELTKLSENIYRDVNIALANELAMMCEELGA